MAPVAISDLGHVVGHIGGRPADSGFIWQDGTLVEIGTLPGFNGSEAMGVNNLGQVVGWVETDNSGTDYTRAFFGLITRCTT